jgi:hypothetical protein
MYKATPAIAGDRLRIRTLSNPYYIRIGEIATGK